MITVYNPHTQDVSITFEGKQYTIKAGGETMMPTNVAHYWVTRIHNFLITREVASVAPDVKAEVPAEQAVESAPIVEKKTPAAKAKK